MKVFAIALLLAGLLCAGAATAQPLASGSVFPGSLDNFKQKLPGDTVNASEYDALLDATNKLEQRSLASPPTYTACANVTLAAGVRDCSIDLVWPSAFASTNYVPVLGEPVDTGAPSRLTADGIQSKTVAKITVCVWNRDATASRTGVVCALAR